MSGGWLVRYWCQKFDGFIGLKVALVVGAILQAEPLHAQAIKPAIVAYSAAAAADWLTTAGTIHAGGHEANPMLTWGGPQNTPAVLATGIAMDVAILYSVHKWVQPHHPRLAAAFLFIGAGVRAGEVARNVQAWHQSVVVCRRSCF